MKDSRAVWRSGARVVRLVDELGACYAEVAARAKTLSESALQAALPGRAHSSADMLFGLVAHGAYHGGQIALLKKQVR